MEPSPDLGLHGSPMHMVPSHSMMPFAAMGGPPDLGLAAGSEPSSQRKAHSSERRRPLRFWQPFNDWWRAEFERNGKRPAADDIMRWAPAPDQDL